MQEPGYVIELKQELKELKQAVRERDELLDTLDKIISDMNLGCLQGEMFHVGELISIAAHHLERASCRKEKND